VASEWRASGGKNPCVHTCHCGTDRKHVGVWESSQRLERDGGTHDDTIFLCEEVSYAGGGVDCRLKADG